MAQVTGKTLRHVFKNSQSNRQKLAVLQGKVEVYQYETNKVVPAASINGSTIEKMKQTYEDAKHTLTTLDSAVARLNAFKGFDIRAKPKIDQIICTGIGSFSSYERNNTFCNAYHQLVELELFHNILRTKSMVKDPVEILFQDPGFNDLDIEFLQSFVGYKVIKTLEAYNRMTENTLLYALGNYDDIAYHAFRVAEPCLFIGNDLKEWGKKNELPNPDGIQYGNYN